MWLANLRGVAPYGRQHLELTDVMTQFWRYSFHEHGAYDLPAIIDHIVEQKQRELRGQGGEREQQDREEEQQHSAEQASAEAPEPNVEQGQIEERSQPEKLVTLQPEELRQVLLIGHSQVGVGQIARGVTLVELMMMYRVYLRPSTPSWCSAHCIRDSINTSC